MRKHLLFALSAITPALISSAAPLSPEAALQRALGSNGQSKVFSDVHTELSFTKSVEETPMIYMFSRGEGKGFLAVSADDTTVPLLGYSTSGTLPAEEKELPEGMRYWLTSLAEQAAFNSRNPAETGIRRMTETREEIPPMVKTKWNQNSPYNDKCPIVNGQRCVTGCVATAMAQVLRYYSYPVKGTGTHSYAWNGSTLSFDYDSTTFDWNNMKDTYDDASTQEEKDAVATLMYACGVSVDMGYSTSASGAVSQKIGSALIDNFGYDKGVRYLLRDYYTIPEWEKIVYDNLRDFGPVLYGGQSNDGGHQFVCDGYQNGYFHFNWGWGGMSDGYFLLTALDPGSQGIGGSTSGYNFDQDIISNVSTDHISDSYYLQMNWVGDFEISPLTTTKGGQIELTATFYNYSYVTMDNPKVGLLITPVDGRDPIFVQMFNFANIKPNYGVKSRNVMVTLPAGLEDGTYTVTPAYKIGNDGEIRPVNTAINAIRSYTMHVNGNNVTLSAEEPAKITATDFRLESELYKGSDFKACATLKNESEDMEYQGILAVGLYDGNNIVAIGNHMSIVLKPGEALDWEYVSPLRYFNNIGVPAAGVYDVYLFDVKPEYYEVITGPVEAELHNASGATLKIKDVKVEDGQYYGYMNASATLVCTAGYYAGSLRLGIFPYIPGQSVYSVAMFDSEYLSVSAGAGANGIRGERAAALGETEVKWNFNFSNAEAGKEYFTNIYAGNTNLGGQVVFTVTDIPTAIESIFERNSDIVRREFITLTGVVVKEERPEPGLYILREYHSDGTVTTRRAAIK